MTCPALKPGPARAASWSWSSAGRSTPLSWSPWRPTRADGSCGWVEVADVSRTANTAPAAPVAILAAGAVFVVLETSATSTHPQHLSAGLPPRRRPRRRRRPFRRRPRPRRGRPDRVQCGQVTAVGDSVMLDYQDPLKTAIPGVNVDAAVSRQNGPTDEGILQSASRPPASSAGMSSSGWERTGHHGLGLRQHDGDSQWRLAPVVFVERARRSDRGRTPTTPCWPAARAGIRMPSWPTGRRWPPRTPGGSARTAPTSPSTARAPWPSHNWWRRRSPPAEPQGRRGGNRGTVV